MKDIVRTALKDAEEKVKLLFDNKLGTHDVSILQIDDGLVEVLATKGISFLGGEDFDNRLVQYCVTDFKKKNGTAGNISESEKSIARLRRACENAKRTLSNATNTTIEIDSLFDGLDFCINITRAKFEDLCVDLFRETIDPVEDALKQSELSKNKIDEVVLVGGSSRIPKIQSLLSTYFNDKELNKSVNPDEAVAHGAGIQGAILSGIKDKEITDMLLIDVCPLSIGIETSGRVMTKIIHRNTSIPTAKEQVFSTFVDNQPAVDIKIFEGERNLTQYCNLLGNFLLSGIPPAPRGTPQITVTMSLDADGILSVKAEDKSTKNINEIKIENRGKRPQSEIDAMVADAEKFKQDDEVAQERYKIINEYESTISQVKGSFATQPVPEELKEQLMTICTEHEEWLQSHPMEDIATYKERLELLQKSLQGILPQEAKDMANKMKGMSADQLQDMMKNLQPGGLGSIETNTDYDMDKTTDDMDKTKLHGPTVDEVD